MQQSINRLYPAKINEYVLFITEKASSTGQKGFMPLGGQYGYVYKSKDKNTPAHELGHGVFRLEHPWSNKLIKTPQAATNLLMDYAGGAELSHFDWKQINDPKLKLYTFQKQTEGEFNDVRLTPDWIPFEYHGSSIHGNNSSCKNNGGICSIEKNGQQYSYISTQRDYINGNDTLKISIVNNPEYVIVVDYSVGCGKLYKVKFKDLQANFNKDSNIDFNNKIFSHYGDVSCITESKKEQEEGIVIPELVGNQNYYKIENTLQQAKASFGNNADIEFSHNGKVYKQNDNGKVEEVKNALSTQQINNGEWSGNVENKIRFTTDEKNIVQVEAFGLNKNIKWKSTNIQKVSDNIREKTNAFLKENNVKDLNAAYSNDTGTFADGDKIKINGSFGKIISEGIEVTTELLKTGQIKEQVYLSNSKAAIHAPGVVTGSVEVAAQKVTDLTSLGKLVYDVATDKQTRADIANQFQNIKNQIGDNPKEFFPILGEVILTVGTGNSSEEWEKAQKSKDNGEKSHLATRGVGNAVITLISGVAIVKELPEIADKLGDAIKKAKKISKNLDGFIVKSLPEKLEDIQNIWKTKYPINEMFEGRTIFEDIMGHYRYKKADGWAHTSDIADNFKGVDFYKDFFELDNVISTKKAVSMKTTKVKDVKQWLISENIKKNIRFLKETFKPEGLQSNGKILKVTESAEIHIYMPRENITDDLLKTWQKELSKKTRETGIKFEIRALEDFIK